MYEISSIPIKLFSINKFYWKCLQGFVTQIESISTLLWQQKSDMSEQDFRLQGGLVWLSWACTLALADTQKPGVKAFPDSYFG